MISHPPVRKSKMIVIAGLTANTETCVLTESLCSILWLASILRRPPRITSPRFHISVSAARIRRDLGFVRPQRPEVTSTDTHATLHTRALTTVHPSLLPCSRASPVFFFSSLTVTPVDAGVKDLPTSGPSLEVSPEMDVKVTLPPTKLICNHLETNL